MEFQFESLGPTLNVVVLLFMIAFSIAILGLVVVLAALPGQIAKSRNHPQTEAVNILGWLGLPTGVLWVFAMVWAYYRDSKTNTVSSGDASDFNRFDEQQLVALETAVASLEDGLKGTNS